MKKFLSLFIVLICLLSACKKDNNTTDAVSLHPFKIFSFGSGSDIRYTITPSYIAKGSTTPVVLETKDIVGSVVVYNYTADLHTGDTLILEIRSNSADLSVNYTVYDGKKLIIDKRADNVGQIGPVNFRYVVTNSDIIYY